MTSALAETTVPGPGRTRRRGRPARISREQIVAAARDLGLDEFSMQDVARALGVSTPALYSHVSGRDDIVRLAAGDVFSHAGDGLDDVTDWGEWLRAWARALREGMSEVGADALGAIEVDPEGVRSTQHGVALMLEAGFSHADAALALWLVARVAFTAPVGAVGSLSAPVAEAREAGGESVSADMASAMDAMGATPAAAAFVFDLDVVLDGLRSRCG